MNPKTIFKKGIRKLKANPQMFYTLAVAVMVVVGFFSVSYLFISIAEDAQDRLVSVRLSSLQDGFSPFANDNLDDKESLLKAMTKLVAEDQTIEDFQVAVLDKQSNQINVIADVNIDDQIFEEDYDFFYDFAVSSPGNSFIFPIKMDEERSFVTVRAMTEENSGDISGWLLTRQSLSEADRNIHRNLIYTSIIGLVIVIFILLLFFRQSKIIDYIALYRKLKDVGEAKDVFLSMVVHELRSPLTAIRGYVEFLREEKDLSKQGIEHLDIIESHSSQLVDLIGDMLDVAKIQQGKLHIKSEVVDPSDIAESVYQLLSGQAKEKGLGFTRYTDKDISIKVDKERLQQVILNFTSNSIKYTSDGEISISIKKELGTCVIEIRDTGIGIGGEDQEHLFEKFYRVKSKDTDGIVGTGLGLWISRQFVEMMGGSVYVESMESIGSKFVIKFPIAGE